MRLAPRRIVCVLGLPGPAYQAALTVLRDAAQRLEVELATQSALQAALLEDRQQSDLARWQQALQAQRGYALTLLLPAQGGGADLSESERLLRAALIQSDVSFSVLHTDAGPLPGRAEAAMQLAMRPDDEKAASSGAYRRWACPHCGDNDADCERHTLAASPQAQR